MLILSSVVTGCVSISAFASLVWAPVGMTSSPVVIIIFVITAGIKKDKLIIKKKKKEHDKIVLLGKDKLNTTGVVNSKVLIDSYISHYEVFSINNVLSQYNGMKWEIKYPETSVEYVWNVWETYERNGMEEIVDNNGIFWLNEIHIEKGLDHYNKK